ncbi:uncharacterized protein LOC126906878 isoform X2 [Daktulosphaira vitifoliae]|uniref:uncharacterized protein LOC126906878 isoform X2 n=1 Tax=Daktulosphaira vitifoliae TaxID=58002 RepID=UPI0021AA38D1|nr:uncharacterized protein LOC126906878 isoform X2 [Daktulosphaira vitifoliae]
MLKIYLVYVFIASALTQTRLDPITNLDNYTNDFTLCMKTYSMEYTGETPIVSMAEQWIDSATPEICEVNLKEELCPLCKNKEHCFDKMNICCITFCDKLMKLKKAINDALQDHVS